MINELPKNQLEILQSFKLESFNDNKDSLRNQVTLINSITKLPLTNLYTVATTKGILVYQLTQQNQLQLEQNISLNYSYGLYKCFSTKYKNIFIIVPSNETLIKPDNWILVYDSKLRQNKFEFLVKKEIIDVNTIQDKYIFVLTEDEIIEIDINNNFSKQKKQINAQQLEVNQFEGNCFVFLLDLKLNQLYINTYKQIESIFTKNNFQDFSQINLKDFKVNKADFMRVIKDTDQLLIADQINQQIYHCQIDKEFTIRKIFNYQTDLQSKFFKKQLQDIQPIIKDLYLLYFKDNQFVLMDTSRQTKSKLFFSFNLSFSFQPKNLLNILEFNWNATFIIENIVQQKEQTQFTLFHLDGNCYEINYRPKQDIKFHQKTLEKNWFEQDQIDINKIITI